MTGMASGQAQRLGRRRPKALLAAFAAASLLAALSQVVAASGATSAPSAVAAAGTPPLGGATQDAGALTSRWSSLVRQAMGYVALRASVPLEAPTGRLWPADRSVGPNSARVTASADRYDVEIYTCPHPLPLNARGIDRTYDGC